jgi:citrate lyase subunit beta/citryl-CoA lyase
MGISVRISLASPEADLAAAIHPGVSTVLLPRVESANQIRTADALITGLEKRRGIRPGTIELRALVESPEGVNMAQEIASSSPRLKAIGVGPNMRVYFENDGDALAYAAAECELHALAAGLTPLNIQYVLD